MTLLERAQESPDIGVAEPRWDRNGRGRVLQPEKPKSLEKAAARHRVLTGTHMHNTHGTTWKTSKHSVWGEEKQTL